MNRSAFLSVFLCLPLAAAAASGDLDPRFDGDGIRIVDADRNKSTYDRFSVGIVDAQGRVVGSGNTIGAGRDGFVARVLPGGALDPGFGTGGIASLPVPEGFSSVRMEGLVERPDGRLVVAGTLGSNEIDRGLLCQLLDNGTLDPGFGTGGCRQVQFWFESNGDEIVDLALQPDGRVVALGKTDVNGGVREWTVARFETDGDYDLCFGDASCQFGGYLIEPEPLADLGGIFEPRALALAPDGRIVLAGGAPLNGTLDMVAIRLLPTGAVDTGFGNGGHRKVTFNQGGNDFDRADDVVVGPNGRVYLVGQVSTPTATLSGAAALDVDGDLIVSYGDNGRRVFFFDDVSVFQVAAAAALQADGKLVAGGYAGTAFENGHNCAVARLDGNGDPDPLFGFGGYRSYDASPQQDGTLLDTCHSVDLHGGAIFLMGDTGTDFSNQRDSLAMKIDQDTILRDGFEDQP